MEYEGTRIFLSNPEEKLKQLMRMANAKDIEISALKAHIEELNAQLEESKEKAARLHGILTIRGKDKKKITKTAKVNWRKKSKGTPEDYSVRNEEEENAKYSDAGPGREWVGLLPEAG